MNPVMWEHVFNLPVVTQRDTPDNVVHNLREAIKLHFEDESPAEMGFAVTPTVIITCELEPLYA
jgi:hypothetical protein